MKPETNEICVRLGSVFCVVAEQFMPAIEEGLNRTDKEISFGATVKFKKVKGVIEGRLTPHQPKIPTEPMDDVFFTLNRADNGQLSFLFPGSVKDMRREIDNRDVKPEEDGYTPVDNATS